MGRISVSLCFKALDAPDWIRCNAFVDTGAARLVLPSQYKEQLKPFKIERETQAVLADGSTVPTLVCGPILLRVEGFSEIATNVCFINGDVEPLLGYIPLEEMEAAVDMLGRRLVSVGSMDLKWAHGGIVWVSNRAFQGGVLPLE